MAKEYEEDLKILQSKLMHYIICADLHEYDGFEKSPTSTQTPLSSALEYQQLLSDTDDSDSSISSLINNSTTISTTIIDKETILKKLRSSGKKTSGLPGPKKFIPEKPSCIKQKQYKYHDIIPNHLTLKSSSKEKRANNSNCKRKAISSIQQNSNKFFATPAKSPKMSNAEPNDGVDYLLVYLYSKYDVEAYGTINKINKKAPNKVKFDNAKSKKLNRDLRKLQMGASYKYKTSLKKQKKIYLQKN